MLSRALYSLKVFLVAICALSCMPVAAFGAVDVPVQYQGGGTETKVGIQLRQTQISVDAPAQVVFEHSDGLPWDLDEQSGWPDILDAQVGFKNKSAFPICIAGASVAQNEAANIGAVFGTSAGSADNPFLTLLGTDKSKAVLPVLDDGAQADFDFSACVPDDSFAIGAASAGVGTERAFGLQLNRGSAACKDYISLGSDADSENTVVPFAMFTWTFAQAVSVDPALPDGATSSAFQGFSLKIAGEPVSDGLKPYAGNAYSLKQVQRMSKALGSGSAGEDSSLYGFFHAIVTSMAPEGDYDCRVRYDGQDWPVRIIGLNQDVASDTFHSGDVSYAEGDTVGLTFQFRDIIEMAPLKAGSSTNEGGWGGENASDAREALQEGGKYYENMTAKSAIVPVSKRYVATVDATAPYTISQKMFLASFRELVVTPAVDRSNRVFFEGLGPDYINGVPYLFYQGKSTEDRANNGWLVKNIGPFWSGQHVIEIPSDNSTFTSGGSDWWQRTAATAFRDDNSERFIASRSSGVPNGWDPPSATNYGIVPCFCL